MRDIYSEVTARIVAELETGAVPWVKPWSAMPGCNHPHNAGTGRPYSGCNVVLLWMATQKHNWPTMRFLTFNQAKALGGDRMVRHPRGSDHSRRRARMRLHRTQ